MTAITMPAENNANIQASTRELWRRTVQRQVFMKNPMLARMLLANRMTWKGGQNLIGPLDIAEVDDHIQWYGPKDGLTVKTKTVLTLAKFKWKSFQLPVQYGQEEDRSTGQGGMTEVFDLKRFLVEKANRGTRIALVNQFYGTDSSGTRHTDNSLTATDYESVNGDTDKKFQSALQALTHDAPYGGITRTASTNTNDWAQGASLDGSYTDWNTGRTIGPDLIEQMQDSVMEHAGDYTASDFLFVMGPANYRALRKYAVTHKFDMSKGLLANYGIESFTMNGWEVAKDYRLQAKYINGIGTRGGSYYPAQKWVFCFCIPTWELRFHQNYRFRFSGFTWQAMIANGRDEYLARILGSGNFVCWQPNANCFQANIT